MNTKEAIRYIIQEWLEYKLPSLIERDIPSDLLNTGLIIALVGVRRSGKTYLLYQIAKRLKEKLPSSNIIYINFEDERLYPLTGKELPLLFEVYEENFSYNRNLPLFLLLDEIHNHPSWERVLRNLYDKYRNVRFIITGSSARLLSSEIASSLRGRTITLEVFPFNFKEFLGAKGIKFEQKGILHSPTRHEVIKAFNEYLEFGGFPQIVFESMKMEILREYYQAIVYRDIVERYTIRNLRLFETFLKLVVQSASNLISFGKLANLLKGIGFKVSKNTLIGYMGYLKEAFFAFEVPIFSYSIKDQLQYPRKIYLVDVGLVNALSFKTSYDFGKLAENIVFLHLSGKDVYYWKNRLGYEVDFVVREGLETKELIQVCWDIRDEETKKREIRAILAAMDEFKLTKALILTKDFEGEELFDQKIIVFTPLWLWLVSR
ncbi:MAG: ATP-binding protein [bacterium]